MTIMCKLAPLLDSYCVTTKLLPINWIIKLFKSHILLKKIISVCFLLLLSVKEEAGALNYGAHPHTHSVSLLGGFPLKIHNWSLLMLTS